MRALTIVTRIEAPVSRCFDLSLSVDGHTASMASSAERAIDGVTSGMIGPGESVTWRARHFGIPFRLTSRITAYDRPRRFVDEQVAGPFTRWWHEHEFSDQGEATLMTDRIEFAAPFGPLGRLAERVVLVRYMERLILERNSWLKRELEHGSQA